MIVKTGINKRKRKRPPKKILIKNRKQILKQNFVVDDDSADITDAQLIDNNDNLINKDYLKMIQRYDNSIELLEQDLKRLQKEKELIIFEIVEKCSNGNKEKITYG